MLLMEYLWQGDSLPEVECRLLEDFGRLSQMLIDISPTIFKLVSQFRCLLVYKL